MDETTKREATFEHLAGALALATSVKGEAVDPWTWRYADGDVCEACDDTLNRPEALFSEVGGVEELCFCCAAKFLRLAMAEEHFGQRPGSAVKAFLAERAS